MTEWADFPHEMLDPSTDLFRIHLRGLSPAWFNSDGTWRFDPPSSHRGQYGACYAGLEQLSSYVEVFGRFRMVPQAAIDARSLSRFSAIEALEIADLTDRTVLGGFGVTAAHSTGTDYGSAQDLSGRLFDAGFDGILYRVRHDPAMALQGIAVFGEPGESPDRFSEPKTGPVPGALVDAGRAIFGIVVVPAVPLP